MSRRKRMLEELDQDIRDHIAQETQGQHRSWHDAGRGALRSRCANLAT